MEKPACPNPEASTPLTTFVHADINTFRELVQHLTGSSDADRDTSASKEGASRRRVSKKRSIPTIHERRSQYAESKLEIMKPCVSKSELPFSPSKSCKSGSITSPSATPSKSFTKLSILEHDTTERRSVSNLNRDGEEKAVMERRFYLSSSSPRPKHEDGEPELLHLFPLTSPRANES